MRLTGIMGTREQGLRYRLESEVWRATRYSHFLALVAYRNAAPSSSPGEGDGDREHVVLSVIRSSIRRTDVCVPAEDGTHFLILPETAESGALALAHRLAESTRPPQSLHDRGTAPGALIGIAIYPGDATTASGLVECLEALMRSEAARRGRICIVSHSLPER